MLNPVQLKQKFELSNFAVISNPKDFQEYLGFLEYANGEYDYVHAPEMPEFTEPFAVVCKITIDYAYDDEGWDEYTLDIVIVPKSAFA